MTGALVRALLVIVLLATPALFLPGVGSDSQQMVALLAVFSGALVFVEYNSTYPGLIEFRDAPPFNRVRFLSLFFTVFLLTMISRGETSPTTLTVLADEVGALIGRAIDFPLSPVRLITTMVSENASQEHLANVRKAAGLAYLISLMSLAAFVILLKFQSWPSRSSVFNVWINLPTFDPTAGGDVVDRLDRDARINIALGFLLPFLIPAVVKSASTGFPPVTLESPQTLIWTVSAWAFLPASLFMRGIAMGRIAEMIREKRRLTVLSGEAALSPA